MRRGGVVGRPRTRSGTVKKQPISIMQLFKYIHSLILYIH